MFIFRSLLTIILCLTTLLAQAAFVQGLVGQDPMKLTQIEPQAIVMQDAHGQDALVVFYRLREQKKEHLVGFSVARNITSKGQLIWDKDYVLKPEVFSTQGFAPKPVLLNGTLYLFGGDNYKQCYYQVLYNTFDTLDDLINHTQGKKGNTPAQYLDIQVSTYDTYLSAIVGENSQQESRILLSYYVNLKETDPTFNYSSCTQSRNLSLKCTNRYYWKKEDIYGGELNHANVDIGGVQKTLMFTAHVGNRYLNFFTYDFNTDLYQSKYTLNGRNGNTALSISNPPSATAQLDDALVVYFKLVDSNDVFKTFLDLNDIDKTTGANWSAPIPLYGSDGKRVQSYKGLDAVQFQSRTYVFYSSTVSRKASYFSE